MKKNEWIISERWDTVKPHHNGSTIIRREKETGEKITQINDGWIFTKLHFLKNVNLYIQEAQQLPRKDKHKEIHMQTHQVKMLKAKT